MRLMLQQAEADDYVIATGETHSVRELCEQAFGRLGLDFRDFVEIDPRYFRPAEVDLLQGCAEKARTRLDWRPRVSFVELVAMMVDADMELAERERALAAMGHATLPRQGRPGVRP
jgi:GDPmannose 4,6-dehydratase